MANSIKDVADHAFDYVIAGGGTAGLALAAGLAANSSTQVLVLEAGPENLEESSPIRIPAPPGVVINDPKYAWVFKSSPQKHLEGREVVVQRGRTLGGSSAVNFTVWNHPPAGDVDAWEKLGNPGWNWELFQKYAKKAESFTSSSPERQALYRQEPHLSSHGVDGPLKTKFPDWVFKGDVIIQDAMQNLGIPVAKDPYGGDPIGTSMLAACVDPRTHTRSYAATAYYLPNKEKANLKVLCNAIVERVVFNDQHNDENVEASGVQFIHDGVKHVVHVRKEVVICAGALKTPQILELSGIGSRDILEPLGIKPRIILPGVGENLQEHAFCGVTFELQSKNAFETLDLFNDKAFAAEQHKLHKEQKGMAAMTITNFCFAPLKSTTETPSEAVKLIALQRQNIEERIRSGTLPPGLKEQWMMQLERMEEAKSGECEIVIIPGLFGGAAEPGKAYVTLIASANSMFSRGSVHVTSSDPNVDPAIDLGYFAEEFDLKLVTEMIKFARRLGETEPLKSIIAKETVPGSNVTTDEQIQDYIKRTLSSTYHTVSTAVMLPRDMNGVVDSKLRVYGTKNVRVADISIVPLHVAAHTQSTAYVIGGVAADIIMKDT